MINRRASQNGNPRKALAILIKREAAPRAWHKWHQHFQIMGRRFARRGSAPRTVGKGAAFAAARGIVIAGQRHALTSRQTKTKDKPQPKTHTQ
jgi:hypothetical protein